MPAGNKYQLLLAGGPHAVLAGSGLTMPGGEMSATPGADRAAPRPNDPRSRRLIEPLDGGVFDQAPTGRRSRTTTPGEGAAASRPASAGPRGFDPQHIAAIQSVSTAFLDAICRADAASREWLARDAAVFLGAVARQNIEELSGMNLFAVIGDELHTPVLTDSILPGVTRDSLIRLARAAGARVVERKMPIADLLAQLASGECRELFACGTAAIVCPISAVGDADGREYQPAAVDERARTLREQLLAIQERRAPDPYGWTSEVPALTRDSK